MASMSFIVRVSSLALMILAIERSHALLKPFRTGLRLKQENVKRAIAIICISTVQWSCPFRQRFFVIVMDPWSKDSTLITQSVLRSQTNEKTEKPALFLYCYGSLIKGLYFDNTNKKTEKLESDNDDDGDDDHDHDDEALDISILSTLSQQTPAHPWTSPLQGVYLSIIK